MNACGGINDQNSDVRYDRPLLIEYTADDVCGQIEKVLSSPAMSAPDSSLVALHFQPCDHGGWGVECGGSERNQTIFGKLIVAQQTSYKGRLDIRQTTATFQVTILRTKRSYK
jgi:hypothetical protein